MGDSALIFLTSRLNKSTVLVGGRWQKDLEKAIEKKAWGWGGVNRAHYEMTGRERPEKSLQELAHVLDWQLLPVGIEDLHSSGSCHLSRKVSTGQSGNVRVQGSAMCSYLGSAQVWTGECCSLPPQ